jgi:hypothetical protein
MLRRAVLSISLLLALIALSLVAPACWDDECNPPCEPGYACFYGACLSRGFCPANDPNADTCARYSDPEAGPVECIQRVDHGICDRGYVCECQEFDIDDRCTRRQCVPSTEDF